MGMHEWDGEKWVHKSGGIGTGGNGEPGADGYSPTATVEQTSDGAVITITDKKGTTTATVKNGKDGRSAYAYAKDGGYTGTEAEFAAKLAAEYPETLPNPKALTINGQRYDGSEAVEVEVTGGSGIHIGPDEPTDENVNAWIDTDEDEGSTAQPDWNAAEGEAGHILNRTHYKELVELVNETPEYNSQEELFVFSSDFAFTIGETYIVNWNGVEYTCVSFDMGGVAAIGNYLLVDDVTDTGEPFIMLNEIGELTALPLDGSTEASVVIAGWQVTQIPQEYIPDPVFWVDVQYDGTNCTSEVTYADLLDAFSTNRQIIARVYYDSNGEQFVIHVPLATASAKFAVPMQFYGFVTAKKIAQLNAILEGEADSAQSATLAFTYTQVEINKS
jgi:hypothetical protein